MLNIFPVVKDVWCLRRASYLTCSYVVQTSAGVVFIDASMDGQGRDVRLALEHLKLQPHDVRAAIVTHWHNDHSSGADYIAKVCGAPIFTDAYEGAKLTDKSPITFLGKVSQMIPESGPLVLFKGILKDGPAISLDSFTAVKDGDVIRDQFEIITTPGHTPGHISVFDRVNRILFAGDALAVVHGRLRRMARPVTEDLVQGHQSMLKLLSVDADTICPGHREPLLNARAAMQEFRRDLELGRWPLLG